MHTISKKLAKREKRARFPHERARKIFWSRLGVYVAHLRISISRYTGVFIIITTVLGRKADEIEANSEGL